MRSRLNLLTAGVTTLVVIAFVLPLGFLVSRQADQRGRLAAERSAQTLAAVVVRSAATSAAGGSAASLDDVIGPIPDGSAVIAQDRTVLGDTEPDLALVDEVLAAGTALSAYNGQGFGIAIPVFTVSGPVVVYSSVPASELDEGVLRAWLLLGLLGVGLVAASLLISDRLGRAVVGPSRRIAQAAEELGKGALDTRVEEEGPVEMVAIAAEFNRLAERIRGLLAAEREEVADLSHRLRTPLAALRLQVEQLEPVSERTALTEHVDRLGRAVDELINEVRQSPVERSRTSDIVSILESRVNYWRVLAADQERAFHIELGDEPAHIAVTREEATAALDALIGNVFAHTPAGTGFGVLARVRGEMVEVEVADDGSGFPAGIDPLQRGSSGAGSSGLGLDIARQLAADAGGGMTIGSSHTGGARVMLELPLVSPPEE